jgi:hypothetical protein
MKSPWEVSEQPGPAAPQGGTPAAAHQTGSVATVTSQGLPAAGPLESDFPSTQATILPQVTTAAISHS